MSICIDLPQEVELHLRQSVSSLDEAAKEACLVEFYRQGQLTHHQLATALGLDRYSTDGVLKRHGVFDDISLDELMQQLAIFEQKNSRC